MIENALGLVDSALAAAEPGDGAGQVLVAKGSSVGWLLHLPASFEGRSVQDFVTKVFDSYGHSAPNFSYVTSGARGIWYEIIGSTSMVDRFQGSLVAVDPEVHTEKVLYVPKIGHVRDRYARDYEELKKQPGAVEFDGYAYMKVRRSEFNKALSILMYSNDVPGVHRLTFESVGPADDYGLAASLFPGQNPRITEKMLPDLAKRMEALKADMRDQAAQVVEFCRGISAHNAVRAYKLLD